jgi:hypothetical protein
MKFIKKYEVFLESGVAEPTVKPGIKTPTRKMPARPSVIPGKKPGVEDAPLAKLKQPGTEATLEDVFNRLVNVAETEGIDIDKLIAE